MVKTNTFPICFPKMFPQLLRRIPHRKVQTSFFKGILVESSSNARRFFFKKSRFLVFRIWSVFFRFPSFFVLTCCKLGALDFIILLRFHSNRIIQTRIFLYVCTTPAAVAAAVAPAEPAAATPPPRRPPPPRPSPPWSPPPRPPPPRNEPPSPPRGALRPPHPKFKPAHFVRVSCRKFKIVVNLDFLGCQHLE